MVKKGLVVLLTIVTMISIALYIIVSYTNLFAEPTYTLSDEIKIIKNSNELNKDNKSVVYDDSVYIDLDTILNEFEMDINWDEEERTAVFYNESEIIRFYGNTSHKKINRNTQVEDKSMIVKNGQPLFSLEFIDQYSDYDSTYIKDTNRVIIDKEGRIEGHGKALTQLRVRNSESIWAEVVDILEENENIYVYKFDNEWSFIRTERGFFGYIRNEDMESEKIESIPMDNKEGKKAVVDSKKEKINLTWEFIYRKTPSTKDISTVEGLDVISPTWFNISNDKGDIRDKADIRYTRWAHKNGYEVWGLFSNDFDPDLTHEILNSSRLRETVINNITDLAIKYEMEGINIDFENVYLKDKDMLTQFLKELYPIAKENDLIISIDITIESQSPNWSQCYDRENIGKYVDYIMLMAYDEYWAGGGVSGSVASLPWVESGVENLLSYVSSDKIILGVPFYTRVWREEYIDGELKAKPYAVSMDRADELLEKNNGTVVWDDKVKQNYGEYKRDGAVFRVWLEDEKSMKSRVDLVNKYNLAGIASWRRGFEKEEIWEIINKNLN